MLAAEAAFSALASDAAAGTSGGRDVTLTSYNEALRASWVWDELRIARNIRPVGSPGPFPGPFVQDSVFVLHRSLFLFRYTVLAFKLGIEKSIIFDAEDLGKCFKGRA